MQARIQLAEVIKAFLENEAKKDFHPIIKKYLEDNLKWIELKLKILKGREGHERLDG